MSKTDHPNPETPYIGGDGDHPGYIADTEPCPPPGDWYERCPYTLEPLVESATPMTLRDAARENIREAIEFLERVKCRA